MLHRASVLAMIDAAFADAPVVLTLGGTAREMLHIAGERPNHFILLDAMGQAPSVALGLALAVPASETKIVAVEGDGSLLMGLSALSTVGRLRPPNLVLFVLDNGVYLATGGQPTGSADTDFATIAQACGWVRSSEVRTTEDLAAAVDEAIQRAGPTLVRVFVDTVQLETPYYLADPVVLSHRFTQWLGERPAVSAC